MLASPGQNIYLVSKSIFALKIAHLLSDFLSVNKRLDLPGIGSFALDPAMLGNSESYESGKNIMSEGIAFEANPGIKDSPDLVSYIAEKTGKIKALAAADLDSHLELARQFLNIGKPFLFEGIGSLSKLQSGKYSFSAGEIPVEKAATRALKESMDLQEEESQASGFRSIFYVRRSKGSLRKPLIAALLLGGIILAVWGGYKVYKSTTAKNNSEQGVNTDTENAATSLADTNHPASDTSTTNLNNNPAPAAPVVTPPAGFYKFVVERADKKRGLTRFNKLKGYGIDIRMETPDSLSFKLFFLLSAVPTDTTRVLDSLRRLYTPSWDKAYIEK